MIIEDDESDYTDAEKTEAETIASAGITPGSPERGTITLRGTGQAEDRTSKSSVPVDASAPNIWYDMEDGRCIDDKKLLPSLELEEPSSHISLLRYDPRSLHHPLGHLQTRSINTKAIESRDPYQQSLRLTLNLSPLTG